MPPSTDQIIGQARSWTSRFGEEAEGDRQETCFCPHFSSRLRFDKAAAPLSWEMPTNHWVSAPKNSRPALHHVYKHKNTPTKKLENITSTESQIHNNIYSLTHKKNTSTKIQIWIALLSIISYKQKNTPKKNFKTTILLNPEYITIYIH